MVFGQILFGISGLVSVFFVLFPKIPQKALEMDTIRLVSACVLVVCIIYWTCWLVVHLKGKFFRDKRSRYLVQSEFGHVYLVEKRECWHIPDPETLNYLTAYFGLNMVNIQRLSQSDIGRKFSVGKQLPSIRLHFSEKEDL